MMDCPCCGQKLVGELPIDALANVADGSPTAKAIVGVLSRVYPRGLTRRAIAERIYGQMGSGGPLTAESVISVTLHRVKPSLRACGWDVLSKAGRDGNVRLARIAQ